MSDPNTTRPSLAANIAGLRPIAGLLATVTVCRSTAVLYPLYGAYLASERQELSIGMIGVIVGMFGIGALLAGIFAGALTARIPEQRVGVLGLVGVAVTVLGIAANPAVWPLLALTVVWGFCYELVNPIAYTLVARALPESSRRFAFSAVRLAINLGMGVGPVLAALLYSVDPELLPWGTAIGYVASALILVRARIGAGGADEEATADDEDPGNAEPARHSSRFWSFIAVTTPIHFAYALPSTVVSVYIVQVLDHPVGWVGAIFAVNSLLIITCEIPLNHAMLGLTRRSSLLAGYACGTAGFALMGLGSIQIWLVLVATAVWTVGEMIIYPVMPSHISFITPKRLHARNMGFYTAHFNAGVILAPLIFLPLAERISATALWLLVGGILLLGLLATAAVSRSPRLWGVDDPRPPTLAAEASTADSA
ncbi:MFS transporter [Glycomyces xiaoerkulensis]|uniref:MFS transporter n=1 Tax=Glycomyces xiaoerkulensis TaxID=2038139 RepID=UPI000C26B94C|nr:MFS transporter [Glycomyces xiaoerkulensis]